MIIINGNNYSGHVIHDDEDTLLISIYTISTLTDLCVALNNVTEVEEELLDGTSKIYVVNRASNISSTGSNVFNITFQKKRPLIEEMNAAIDSLLVMVLEG